jgi:hypothetical protein
VKNLVVERNQFYIYDPFGGSSGAPKRNYWNSLEPAHKSIPRVLFPADGQVTPLWENHKYRGHPLKKVSWLSRDGGLPCARIVTRPTVFVYRMSGHSTYHLWENNLGPFYATLQDTFDLVKEESELLKHSLNDPQQLLISFVDDKPRLGPKAPHLLDQLLRSFTSLPLINASRISQPTCFTTAIVGISASEFPHRKLVSRILQNVLGEKAPPPLPQQPNCIYISRNHPKVVRGRKMINEEEVLPILAAVIANATGKALRKVHMEDLSYKEQIDLAMHSNIMFSPHGGGVANCIWMRRGSVVVEFVAPVGKTLPGMYHRMCSASGVQHFHFLADADPLDANIRVNARLFSNLIMPPQRMVDNALKALKLYREAYDRAARLKL